MVQLSSNSRIAKNTLALYGRMLFNLVVSLYTSRVVLHVLGVADFGIYQLVAGIVSMFTFINGSLAGATSRFLAYELGLDNVARLQRTFSAILNVHLLVAIVIFLLSEAIGNWLIFHYLVIPHERLLSALVVFQLSVIMTMVSIVQIPYNSAIIAHEKMTAFAYIGVTDTCFKLLACIVLCLLALDKLIVYAVLLLMFSVIILLAYYTYCRRHFVECRCRWSKDWEIARPILMFSGWDLFGNFSLIVKNQGVNIFLNLFFGIVLNAACGFANTVYGAVVGFANNFMLSVRPAITKAYAMGDIDRMKALVIDGSKYSFCLMLLLSLPFFFEGDFILHLWLKTPPEWTSILCKLQLLVLLIAVVFFPVKYGIYATGKNKLISVLDGVSVLAILPLTYWGFKMGWQPYTPFWLMICVEFIKSSLYPYLLKRNIKAFSILEFYKLSVGRCLILFGVVIFFSWMLFRQFEGESWTRFLSMLTLPSMFIIAVTYVYMIDKSLRQKINVKIRHFL